MKFSTFFKENSILQDMRKNSVDAENKFRNWLRTQDDATKEVNNIISMAKNIKDEAIKKAYLKKEKHIFDTKWLIKYKQRDVK